MPVYQFLWHDENEKHVAAHGVTAEEFEEVAQWGERRELSRSSGLPIVIGSTATGKRIACVFEDVDGFLVIPVTAYEVQE